ncbi:NAD(P)-dependent oxidoreductase [Streptomyces rimosus]|uniref:NAD-dependent epimerase/dehydratase family protein n=1 Tax=Streptomyces rimosus TaxID=1927 RepID=UPI000519B186|nr:NAD(P)-dependent oxidoreductase [Streptomyces rimosus]
MTADRSAAQAARAVVLGSTGFAGRHIRETFEAAGTPVIGVARSERAPGARRLDLCGVSVASLAALLRDTRPTVVVNAAGAVWNTAGDQLSLLNAALPAKLADAVALLPARRRPRLVQLGSVYEYGSVPDGTRLTEDRPPATGGHYGHTKLQGTRALLDAAGAGALTAVVLRVANMVGPGAPPASLPGMVAGHLTAARAASAATGRAPALRLTPLVAHRDYVDVRDVAEAVLRAATCDAAVRDRPGRVFNIGRGETVAVRGLVRRMIELSGLPVELVEEGDGEAPRGDTGAYLLDVGAAGRELSWRPRRGLDQSLGDLLRAPAAG